MANKAMGLNELLVEDLRDLLDAEKQLVKALPKMAKAASNEELAEGFRQHLEVTKGQVQRLEEIFAGMGEKARSKPCAGMKGLVEEGSEIIEEHEESGIRDAALLTAARKVEHYEMIGYESARALALQAGESEAAELLQQTLREEADADKLLAQLSKRLLKEASSGSGQEAGNGRQSTARKGRQSTSGNGRQSASGDGRQSSRGQSTKGKSRSSGASGSRVLTDHEEIQQWAEERNARPACVKGTGGKQDTGMIRLNFPGYSGEDSLQDIDWEDWFEKFDENGLALVVQDTLAGKKQKSNFNKLVSRESVEERPRSRTAR